MGETEDNSSVLVLNAGSSSVKSALFTADLTETLSGIAENIGGASFLIIAGKTETSSFIDHNSALSAVLAALKRHGYDIKTLMGAALKVRPSPKLPPLPR